MIYIGITPKQLSEILDEESFAITLTQEQYNFIVSQAGNEKGPEGPLVQHHCGEDATPESLTE